MISPVEGPLEPRAIETEIPHTWYIIVGIGLVDNKTGMYRLLTVVEALFSLILLLNF